MCSNTSWRDLKQPILVVDDMKLLFPRQKFRIVFVCEFIRL